MQTGKFETGNDFFSLLFFFLRNDKMPKNNYLLEKGIFGVFNKMNT